MSRKQCHFLISALSFIILLPLIILNFQLENIDDVFIRNYGSWIDALMIYTPRDGRHIISFLNAGLYHLGFTFRFYQIFSSVAFIASFIYLINSTISLINLDKNPLESAFFAISSILFPFMFDFYQWTSAYLIYAVGFASIGTSFLCISRFDGLIKILAGASFIALSACAYQPLILLPFVILALSAFFKDAPAKLSAIPTQIMLLVSSLGLYFIYNEILKRLWEISAPKVVLQRTLSIRNIPANLRQQLHSTHDIFLSEGAYHNLLYKPLALLLLCIMVGLVITALLQFDLKKFAYAVFLIVVIPTPIILLQPVDSYWPAPRVSFYINFLFPLGLLALLEKFQFKTVARYSLCGVLVLIGGNAFSIMHHRWLQDRLDKKAAYSIINQINARNDRPLTVVINPSRIQNWQFSTYELGGTIFWAPYASTPYMNALAGKHFDQNQITFQRDDGKNCPENSAKIPPHTLCPSYN
nr:glucosyltransferase domain-containing protein [uncultured Acetobacter sp.]